jgi:gas vesicle protein
MMKKSLKIRKEQNMPSEEPKNHETEGFLAGLMLGSVIGAGIAMFLSGEDGKEIRTFLKRKSKEALKTAKVVTAEGREKIQEVAEEVGQVAEEKIVEAEKSGKKSLRRFFIKAGKKLA